MNNAALLLMDFQAGVADQAWAAAALERAAVARVAARQRGLLTVFTHVSFREGFPEVSARNKAFWGLKERGALPTGPARFMPSLAPGEGELVVAKNRFSAFCGNDLGSLLRARSVTKLVLAGITTSGVVLSTALVASDLDFEVAVLADACADDDGTLHQALVSDLLPRSCNVLITSDWAHRSPACCLKVLGETDR
jgi:nicotinamidase-related amidase